MDASPQHAADAAVTIVLEGRQDAVNAPALRFRLTDHIEAGQVDIVVDMAAADFVDSAALAALVQGMKRCRERGGDLSLVLPIDESAARVFRLTKFDQVFRVLPAGEARVA